LREVATECLEGISAKVAPEPAHEEIDATASQSPIVWASTELGRSEVGISDGSPPWKPPRRTTGEERPYVEIFDPILSVYEVESRPLT